MKITIIELFLYMSQFEEGLWKCDVMSMQVTFALLTECGLITAVTYGPNISTDEWK
jgi:hypothetical protein